MTVYIVTFIVGVLFGGVVGVWWAKRNAPASVFVEGDEEADELRNEAAKVVHARIEKRKARIIEVAKKEGMITNDGVEDMFCIGDSTSGNYLRQLVDVGLLEKIGKAGRGVYYVPTEKS